MANLDFHITVFNDTDRCFDTLINGKAYRYFFMDGDWETWKSTAKAIYNKSPGKCLGWLKKRCTSWEPINGPS